MNKIRWFFMSKYKKLLYSIECAESNGQRLHLPNGIILDFTSDEVCTRDLEDCSQCNKTRCTMYQISKKQFS